MLDVGGETPRNAFGGHVANGIPNLDALQRNVDLTRQLGLVHAKLDVQSHADLSMVEEAAKRLK